MTITLSLLASGGIILLPFTSSVAAIIALYGINTLYSIRRDIPAVVGRLRWKLAHAPAFLAGLRGDSSRG